MGFITDAFGLTNFDAQDEANKISRDSLNLQKQTNKDIKNLTKEQINFNLEQYSKWKDIFGDNFDDLGTYFKNLTGDVWAAKNITAIQQKTQQANQQLQAQLAQRGLSGSGIEASLLSQNLMQGSLSEASILANKDEYAAQQKLEFARLGMQQQGMLLGNLNNAYNSGKSALGGISAGYTNTGLNAMGTAQAYSNYNSSSMGGLYGSAIRYFGIK